MAVYQNFNHESLRIKRSADDQPSMWDDFQFGRPGIMSVYYNDFHTYDANDWTVTETQAGATEATTDSHGGVLLITNTAADNDIVGLQLGESSGESLAVAAGRNIWFECRFQINDATQSDFVIGLHVTDTSPVASAPADGIYFRKDDGDTSLDCVCRASSTSSEEAAVATVADTTNITVGFKVTGTGLCEFWVNNVLEATLTTQIPTTEIRPSFCIQNGEAVAKTMSVDYIIVAATR